MYFTLTSVLPYFEGFKLALFDVIFYPKFNSYRYRKRTSKVMMGNRKKAFEGRKQAS